MTPTPFTDAARQSVALAREAFERRDSQDPLQRARERMSVEMNAAVLIGVAELLDSQLPAANVAAVAIGGFASSIASLVLTMAGGNKAAALDLARLFIQRIDIRVAAHIRAATEHEVTETAAPQSVGGNA